MSQVRFSRARFSMAHFTAARFLRSRAMTLSIATALLTLVVPRLEAALPAQCLAKLNSRDKHRLAQLKPGIPWQWLLEKEEGRGQKGMDPRIAAAKEGKGHPVLYDVDLFSVTKKQITALQAKNKIVICYFAAGSVQFSGNVDKKCSRNSRARLGFARAEMKPQLSRLPDDAFLGRIEGWKDNCWLDVRSPGALAAVKATIKQADAKGCDGVEFDNMDMGLDPENLKESRLKGAAAEIRRAQLAFNREIADYAHSKCLLAGLKNGHQAVREQCRHFDFGVVEGIVHEGTGPNARDRSPGYPRTSAEALGDWKACARSGKPVFAAEYADRGGKCKSAEGLSVSLFPDSRFVSGGRNCPATSPMK